jgi:hypothetical protein
VEYIFNVNKGIVHRVRSQAMRKIEHDTGRPPTRLRSRDDCVYHQPLSGWFPLSPKQVRQHVSETFRKEASSSWIWRLVSRYPGVFQHTTARPQEDTRMQATKQTCKIHVRNLERYVQNVPTELILNLDEVGSQEWSDQKKREVIILINSLPGELNISSLRKKSASAASRQFQWG